MPRPRISTNLAISADGKISTISHLRSGWTSREDHERFVALRENADAVIVGRGTFENDQMTMTGPKNPLRCIVSRSGKIDPRHPIFSKPGGSIHLLVTGKLEHPAPPSVIVHQTNLENFLRILVDDHSVKHLHCEGGGELIRELAELDLIDEFHVTLAGHTIFGGQKAPTATGLDSDFLTASRHFKISHFEPRPDLGECFVTYTRK